MENSVEALKLLVLITETYQVIHYDMMTIIKRNDTSSQAYEQLVYDMDAFYTYLNEFEQLIGA